MRIANTKSHFRLDEHSFSIVNLAPANAFGIDIASKVFSDIKQVRCIVILVILFKFVDGVKISWHHYVDFESQVACFMHGLPCISFLNFGRWVCEFGTNKCLWDLHSVQVFCVNKASALHRHFAHSVHIC